MYNNILATYYNHITFFLFKRLVKQFNNNKNSLISIIKHFHYNQRNWLYFTKPYLNNNGNLALSFILIHLSFISMTKCLIRDNPNPVHHD